MIVLALLVAVDEVLVVVLLVALGVGFLDAASRGGVVACHGEAHHRAVVEAERTLHEALAVGAASYHHRAVPVLHSSRENFAGACRELVDDYHHFQVLVVPKTVGIALLAR